MELITRTIKNSTCWDWAYVCATFGGKCENCSVHVDGMCAFCAYKIAQRYGEVKFSTHKYFIDVQEEILIKHFERIIKEKYENNNK